MLETFDFNCFNLISTIIFIIKGVIFIIENNVY